MNKRKKIYIKFLTIISALVLTFSITATKCNKIKADEHQDIENISSAYSFNNQVNVTLYSPLELEVKIQSYFTFTNNFDVTINGARDYYTNTITKIVTRVNLGVQEIVYYLRYYDEFGQPIQFDNQDVPLIVYQDGWVKDEYRYLYINMKIDTESDLYYFLQNNGVYAYTYQPAPSTMYDLIDTYVNIIPSTIQKLTSFEIFGFTMFALLGSFILILLIVKVFKGVR